ncbi:MAG: DUF4062 domain-containing protein [Ignavibacteria bacterium]|nr:DUF4062 domain-containing protein [Ignavibacteria bacterium]
MTKGDVKIKTPDQRLRVFVSSTLRELADERKAARAAIESIQLIPVMFELGARPHPPKDLYQAYLDQSHIFIGIYWQSYGWIAENETISGLEDELLLSDKFPRLIYVKEPAPDREKKLDTMLDHIRSHGNVSYKSFSSTEELLKYIEIDLVILISERFFTHSEAKLKSKNTIYNNFPAHLPFLIGREKEISEISDLILNRSSQLITITGPGGIGKTRLSIAVSKSLEYYFEDGLYFADFSSVKDENIIISEIAKLFGISAGASADMTKQIIEFVCDKKILLIIDNFEQLSKSASKISELITKCPNLIIIVTSRNPLELSMETEYNIDALSLPDKKQEISDIEMSPAVILFANRARWAYKKFELNEENIYIVSDICRLLGGIPLAIELAAAKVKMFSLNTIREKLTEKLDLLSGGLKDVPARHKTMKAAIEWSYELLNEDEKKIFRRLSVFKNGFYYEAIEKICCYDISEPFGTIESLITKNFFRKESEINDISRFSMLVLLHKYSSELLEQTGETEKLRIILAEYYFKKLEKSSSGSYGAIPVKINSEWEVDIQNVMNALNTMLSQKRYIDLIEMIYTLWPVFWIFDHDKILEKRIDLNFILQHDKELSDEQTGKLNWLAGSAAMETGDFKTASEKFGAANQYFSKTKNIRGIAWTDLILNSLKSNTDKDYNDEDILKCYNSSADMFNKCGDAWGESMSLQYLAAFEMSRGNFMKAIEAYDSCIKLVENKSIEGYLLSMKAFANIEMGKFENAKSLLRETSDIIRKDIMDEATAYFLQIVTYYFFSVNDIRNAMLFAGIHKNIFSKYNFAPWHMLSKLFSFIDEKIKKYREEEYTAEFRKGMKMNVFKTPQLAYRVLNSDESII